jgi:transcription-repair coupling factor (superfamily II helicase)
VIHALDPTCEVMVFPRFNSLALDQFEPSREIAGRRSSVLRRIAQASKPMLLITTAEAMMERVPAPGNWARAGIVLRIGEAYSEDDLRERLNALGYEMDDAPQYPGAVVFHGRTFEIFPAGALGPFRIQYSATEIQSIAAFNPLGQEEIHEVKELPIDPMSERLGFIGKNRKTSSLFDYAPRADWIADAAVPARVCSGLAKIEEVVSGADKRRRYLSKQDWEEGMKAVTLLPRTAPYRSTPDFSKAKSPGKSLRSFVGKAKRDGARLLLVAAQSSDLRTMGRMSGIRAEPAGNWKEAIAGNQRQAALLADFDRGFVVSARKPLVVVTATDVLGSRAHHVQPMPRAWQYRLDSIDLPEIGAVVVHLQRGLARLTGIEEVTMQNLPRREMIRLVFAGKEAVLVPLAELALVWPYASDPGDLSLDKADGSSWRARRAEAEHEIQGTAKQLFAEMKKRKQRRAPKLVPPAATYEKFVAGFPHFPTMDQAKAIDDVLNDLASGYPMDRVICGDVGFGKTEVALRATAAAVLSGKQVAIAVPTTILARQHVTTFRKRFESLGIRIGMLSRAATGAEMRQVREDLGSGALKVVIGTQALASKAVGFADLGLVVIDEEQHFGAAEKAKLAASGRHAHMLWMSATPIPRTLAAGLIGLRDLSIIASPPVDRVPVATKIAPLSDAAIAAALLREHGRRGQSFLICPRIQDIAPMLARVKASGLDLRVLCIHGKLPAHEIEDAMMRFIEGAADVLLATNIVESGLDIPRANTIVVCWPEKFGLAQLHQLRGRVGRGATRGFAHFLTAAASGRSETRLAILEKLNRPGAGFAISSHDLDLRGAGELLSDRQSGHVQVFGPVLYGHLLRLALDGDGAQLADFWVPELNLQVPELLPANYVHSESVRLEIYVRAARCRSENALEELEDESFRRFGKPPATARGFFEMARLRIRCRERGIIKLDVGPDAVAATMMGGRLEKARSRLLRRDGDRVIFANGSAEHPLKRIEQFLDQLGD